MKQLAWRSLLGNIETTPQVKIIIQRLEDQYETFVLKGFKNSNHPIQRKKILMLLLSGSQHVHTNRHSFREFWLSDIAPLIYHLPSTIGPLLHRCPHLRPAPPMPPCIDLTMHHVPCCYGFSSWDGRALGFSGCP